MCRVLVDGGIETQASYLQTLVLSLACHPEFQSKAQAEVDLVVGDERFPTLEDFDDLPYVRAFAKEVSKVISTIIEIAWIEFVCPSLRSSGLGQSSQLCPPTSLPKMLG